MFEPFSVAPLVMGHYYLSINYYILLHPEQSQQKVLSRYLTCYHVSPETMNFAGAIVIDQWISLVICRENSNFVHNNSFFSTCFTWSAAKPPKGWPYNFRITLPSNHKNNRGISHFSGHYCMQSNCEVGVHLVEVIFFSEWKVT